MKTMIFLVSIMMFFHPISMKYEIPMTTASMADICGISEEEFILLSSVVEAESDRSDSLSGRILICETVINRVESDFFPNTITEVLTQPGQFSTVRNGHSVVNRTDYSDQAVILAFRENAAGDAPEVLFFNCIGFFSGREPYALVDGNYFSL